MKDYFTGLFNYNNWANGRIISKLKSISEPPPKTIELLSHIINAQDLWLERLKKVEDPEIGVWDLNSLQELEILSLQSTKNWLIYLKKIHAKDLSAYCVYKNSKGEEFENSVSGIITHLLTHSHYHRGQINQLLRQSGFDPAVTDYILYLRTEKKD